MKVLTLHQPWASLVALGVKTIETRSWSTAYRGPLAIHAARKVTYGAIGEYRAETWFSDVQHTEHCYCDEGEVDYPCQRGATRTPCLTHQERHNVMLPLGGIVATCTLVDVVPILSTANGRTPLSGGWVRVGDTVLGLNRGGSDDHMEFIDEQRHYGDYRTPPEVEQRYAWLLADVVPVDPPVPFRGGQGLTKTWEPVPA